MTQAGSTRFLIVGAGGRHGATGNHVARQLLARGRHVRAFVRQADERARLPAYQADFARTRELVGGVEDLSRWLKRVDGLRARDQ